MSLDTRNEELDKALESNPIDEQILALARSDKSRKRQIRWLAVSLMLDVLLTIGFGFNAIRANNAANKAETIESAIVARCEATNEARAKNEKLWDYLVEQSEKQPRTPEQQKFRDEFITLKNETFAPSDCNKSNSN